jgi:hypothetical protein
LIYESDISRRGRKNKTYTRSNRVHWNCCSKSYWIKFH